MTRRHDDPGGNHLSGVSEIAPGRGDAPILSVRNLTLKLPKGGDREYAIEDVSLTIDRPEIVCLVGESGSGKSVTAHSVLGLLPPNELTPVSGEIWFGRENLMGMSQKRMRTVRGNQVAMIFQEPMTALNPVMQVGAQIEEVLKIHTGMSRAERMRRLYEVLDDVRLPDPEKISRCYPHELSGGQRQRVMIASALILRPKLIIADEPTTALDVTTQAQILDLLRGLHKSYDTAVLLITHDFGVVADIADRVVVMESGRIVEAGTTDAILGNPRQDYTRKLIAAIPALDPGHARTLPAPSNILELENVSKIYDSSSFVRRGREVLAVSDVSFEIRKGETFGIVGESGSGKSTLARCIGRLIRPSEGRIRLSGEDIASKKPSELAKHRSEIQIVFQDPYRSLNPRRTIGQSLIEAPVNFGLGRADAMEKARHLMGTVGLDPDSLHRYPHQFSGGQRQRICIARALAVDPKVVIADEAVSALDVSVQAQVLSLLEDIRDRFDLTMLFITHDLRVAARICDRVAVMQHGRIVEMGPTGELFRNPQHAYSRSLLDAVPGHSRTFWRPAESFYDVAHA